MTERPHRNAGDQEDHDLLIRLGVRVELLVQRVASLENKFNGLIITILLASAGVIFNELWESRDRLTSPTASDIAEELIRQGK